MVDFSLTARDEELVELAKREQRLASKYARAADTHSIDGRSPFPVPHPDTSGLENPFETVQQSPEGISSAPMTQAMMIMAGSLDADLRVREDSLGSLVLNGFGTPEQKEKYGHLNLAIGLTEAGAGSDPSMIRSTARFDPETNEYVLNGEKIFISFYSPSDGAVTLVRGEPDENGKRPFQTFVVLKGQPGLQPMSPIHKMGMRQQDLSGYAMTDVRVPAIAKLDADFAKTFSKFNHTRPIVAAMALGSCRAMLDFTRECLESEGITIDYARGAASRSAVQDKLVRMEALWHGAWHAVMHAKWKETVTGTQSYGYRTEASIAKGVGGNAARIISQTCLEILGPEALLEHHMAERWFRDVRIADVYEGAGEIQRILIAREVLGYGRELN